MSRPARRRAKRPTRAGESKGPHAARRPRPAAARRSDPTGKSPRAPRSSKRASTSLEAPGAIVSTEWPAGRLGHPRLRVVDGSWHMPHLGRDAHAEFLAEHLPGAVFFDVDAIADRKTALPHMLPKPAQFARQVGALG